MRSVIKKQQTFFFNQENPRRTLSSLQIQKRRTFHQEQKENQQINRRKKEILVEQKSNEVQRQNKILLSKITGIMVTKPKRETSSISQYSQPKKSLNALYKKRNWKRIQMQNAQLLKRIVQQKSHYRFGKSNSKPNPQINRRILTKNIPKIQVMPVQTKTDLQTVRIEKTIDFNGQIQCIEITLTKYALIILGKRQKGQTKTIQIQRQEALEFIQSQCDSHIQGLFDCLSFKDQTLFLLGKRTNIDKLENHTLPSQKLEIIEAAESKQNLVDSSPEVPLIFKNETDKLIEED